MTPSVESCYPTKLLYNYFNKIVQSSLEHWTISTLNETIWSLDETRNHKTIGRKLLLNQITLRHYFSIDRIIQLLQQDCPNFLDRWNDIDFRWKNKP